jgi:penicillin-binding protein 1A
MIRLIGYFFGIGTTLALIVAAGVAIYISHLSKDLPDYEVLAKYEPPVTTRIHASDGSLMAEYARERRLYLPIQAVPDRVKAAFLSAEDKNFYNHPGIDITGLGRAIYVNLQNLGSGRRQVGASTITQQVAKNLFLWPLPGPVRKLLEFPLALWIDLVLPKQRVLEIYLNIAELGPSGQFGANAGSTYAFGRPASALAPREAALLAAILPNPVKRSARNPGPGVRRLAGTYMARAQATGLQRCWSENRGN